jgi:AcrR family transcriptional regulator
MAKQTRSNKTTEKIITSTAEFLELNEESELTVLKLCELAEVNPATVYYHFGSIEELIELAYVRVYTSFLAEEMIQFELITKSALESSIAKADFISGLTLLLNGEGQKKNRCFQLRVAALAASRLSLNEKMNQADAVYRKSFYDLINLLQEKNIVRQDISEERIAFPYSSFFLARPVFDGYGKETFTEDFTSMFFDLILA